MCYPGWIDGEVVAMKDGMAVGVPAFKGFFFFFFFFFFFCFLFVCGGSVVSLPPLVLFRSILFALLCFVFFFLFDKKNSIRDEFMMAVYLPTHLLTHTHSQELLTV